MTDLELHNLSLKAREIWENGTQKKEGWRDEYDKLDDQIAKEIYTRIGCENYCNISMGAQQYLWNHKVIDMEELCLECTGLCYEYFKNQPLENCVKHWNRLEKKDNYWEYDPIETTLTSVIYHKLFGEEFNQNQYHPVKFYVEFGIIVDLDTFEQIKGEDIGGWCFAWDNPQRIMNEYTSLVKGIIHPSRKETQETLQQQETATQMTIFDLIRD